MQPEPPPVTVVDPNAPAATELLASRDPWRPTRRQSLVGATALVVALVVLATTALVQHRAADRRAVLAAERAVSLNVAVLGQSVDSPPDEVPVIRVRNDGPATVTVIGARLGPDNPPRVLRERLLPSGLLDLRLDDTRPCDAKLVEEPVREVLLDVRTARGTTVQRRVGLLGVVGDQVNRAARRRCGYLLAHEALTSTVTPSAVHHGLRLEVDLENTSVLPLTLTALDVPEGVQVLGAPRELRLPPRTSPGAPAPVRHLRLTLRVTSCRFFFRDRFETAPAVVAEVRGPFDTAAVELPLPYDTEGADPWMPLDRSCPEGLYWVN